MCRWKCRAEYQRPHRVDQIFPDRPATQQVGPHRPQRFSECTDQEVYVTDATLFLGDPQTVLSSYTDGMRLVHIKPYVRIAFLQGDQAAKVGDISVHAENAFRNDNDLLVFMCVFSQ